MIRPGPVGGQPLVLGVTGRVASGKSTAAGYLAEQGFLPIYADRIGHQVLGDPQVITQLVARFGAGILGAGGQKIERAALRGLCFGNLEQLRFVERLVHPPVIAEIKRQIAHAVGPVLVEAALIVETPPLRVLCHKLLVVTTPRAEQLRRLEQIRQLSPEVAQQIIAAQSPAERLVAAADFVICNQGTLAEFYQQLGGFYRAL